MNNIKLIDKNIINENDSVIVNILLFGSRKYEYHINSKMLNLSIDFILKTERFSSSIIRIDNNNSAIFMNSNNSNNSLKSFLFDFVI